MGDVQDEAKLLINRLDKPSVSLVRWYVITMVSLANAFNNLFWTSWGPIAQSIKFVYGWTNSKLFWVMNASNIATCLFCLPAAYLIDRKGLRVAIVTCVIFMALAWLSRYIPLSQSDATIMLVLGQCCNGIAVSITMIIPPAVADVWFPVHERTTATAISSLAAVLGAAGAFIVGPLVVSMPTMNGSEVLLNETNADMIKSQVKHYDLVNFWLSFAICLLCIVYLPAKPKSAPSVSAQSHRYSFGEGLKNLLRKPAIWLIAVTFAIPNGFFGNWLAMLYPILNTRVTQKQAGWMSFSGSMGGVVVGLIAARVVDRFKYAMKPIIIVIDVLAAGLFIVFTLMSENIIHVSIEWFYVVVILANSIVSSNLPLFLDITVEISNPIAEGVTSGFLILAMTLGAALALGLSQIRVLGTRWMNWCVCGGYGLAPILLLMFLKVRYLKVEQDKEVTVDCSEKDKETLNKQVEKDKANIG